MFSVWNFSVKEPPTRPEIQDESIDNRHYGMNNFRISILQNHSIPVAKTSL